MRIHHIIHNIDLTEGGAQKLVVQLHQMLRNENVDSRLVLIMSDTVNNLDAVHPFLFKHPYHILTLPKLTAYIKEYCETDDIIHPHLSPALLYSSLAVRLSSWKGKMVYTEHSTYNKRRRLLLGQAIDKYLYARCHQIACISEGTKNALSQWMPMTHQRLRVIENGVPLANDKFFKRNDKKKLIILSIGRLKSMKNYATAIGSIIKLKNNNFEYWIAGVGEEEQHLKELCITYAIENKVKFLGYVSDIQSLMKEADIFLMPSLWEGFGLAVVEAMNAGLPVVVSDVSGIQEIVNTDPQCGLLVDPQNSKSIAEALDQFMSDYSMRIEYGERGFKRSFDFSIQKMFEKYLQFYQNILQSVHLNS